MTSDHRLIGVTGYARHGKDSFAAGLIRHGWTRVSFADPLREMALRLDPIVVTESATDYARMSTVIAQHDWEGAKATPFAAEIRRTLQRLGTDAVRGADEDFWTRIFARRVGEVDGPVVAPDVRFPDEARTIRELGGTVVRMHRPGAPINLLHRSEASVAAIDADFDIVNDRDLDALQEQAVAFASLLEAL